MKLMIKKIHTFIIMGLFVLGSFPGVSLAAKTENIFYYYPNEAGYQSVEENYRDIDILAPQLYTVSYQLELSKPQSTDILKLAKKKRLKVMPLLTQSNFDKQLMTQLLEDEGAQDDLIKDLIKEARRKKFIGWQFDFENINHLDRDRYTDFVEKAYKKFKKKRLTLSVAVIPSTKDYDRFAWTQDWSSGNDIPALAEVSDFVTIMSYDDPASYGPVASITYLQKVLDQTIKDTKADKVSLGIPLYCWQWETNGTGTKKIANISYDRAAETREVYSNNRFSNQYSKVAEAEFFSFIKDDGSHHIIWCDNYQSIQAKQDLIKKYDLRGFSAWALGQEDERIWEDL